MVFLTTTDFTETFHNTLEVIFNFLRDLKWIMFTVCMFSQGQERFIRKNHGFSLIIFGECLTMINQFLKAFVRLEQESERRNVYQVNLDIAPLADHSDLLLLKFKYGSDWIS